MRFQHVLVVVGILLAFVIAIAGAACRAPPKAALPVVENATLESEIDKRRSPVTDRKLLIDVPNIEIDELRSRLLHTRWATSWATAGWAAGANRDELRRLVDYWATEYDWRVHEATINALPSHVADIDGTPVHYLRFDGEHGNSLPIVLTHGWPSSFMELTELARRLATPSQYGGNAEDAFTVVVPSLPGFALSPQRSSLLEALPTHEIWHRLMRDELGFERYAAHGGDLGAGVTSHLGEAYPEAVVGIHLLAIADPIQVDPTRVTSEEHAYLDAVAAWSADEGGYEHEQRTRPLTLAYGLSDSPTGLLAWISEKYRAWSDCNGDLSTRFSDDFLLTQASLYWFTNTISTSFRPYYEYGRSLTKRVNRVDVPTAVAVFPADLSQPPRSWAERTYNVTRYTCMPRGGHFAAHEEPGLLADDVTEFFRTLR
jgi:pimeloyl-ACP methyl ester carboxylesterase